MRGLRYIVRLTSPMPVQHVDYLSSAVPGVLAQPKGKMQFDATSLYDPAVYVPWHALPLALQTLGAWGYTIRSISQDARYVAPDAYQTIDIDAMPELSPEARATIKPFQAEGFEKQRFIGGGYFDWPTGSGKTLGGLLAILSQRESTGALARALVVAIPKTCLQWRNEIRRFTRPKMVNVLVLETQRGYKVKQATDSEMGDGSLPWKVASVDRREEVVAWASTKEEAETIVEQRSTLLDLNPPEPNPPPEDPRLGRLMAAMHRWRKIDIIVISDDLLSSRVDALIAWNPRTVILDEAQNFKAPSRMKVESYDANGKPLFGWRPNQSAAAARVTRKAARVLLLSATRAPDRPRDLWAQYDVIDPYGIGNFRSFALRYCGGIDGKYGLISNGSSHEAELATRAAAFVHKVEHSRVAAELPKFRRQVTFLAPEEADTIQVGQKEWNDARKGGASALLELELSIAAAGKRTYIMKRVAHALEEGRKVLVFTGRRRDCERLGKLAESAAAKADNAKCWCIHGGNSDREASEAREAYGAHTGAGVFVTTSDAMGTGVDGLQKGTSLALIAQLPWNFGRLQQVEGRPLRFGATGDTVTLGVTFEYIVLQNSRDESMLDLVVEKARMAAKVLESEDVAMLEKDLLAHAGASSIEDLAKRLLAGHDDSIDTDALHLDFSPEAARLRVTSDAEEGETILEDEP